MSTAFPTAIDAWIKRWATVAGRADWLNPMRNVNYGNGRIVAPDTFVVDGAEERGHPHFYCNAANRVALFAGFELLSLKQQQHASPVPWHWHVIAELRPQETI